MLKKIIAYLPVIILYHIGDIISKTPLYNYEFGYETYSWVMWKSLQLQDWAKLDDLIWSEPGIKNGILSVSNALNLMVNGIIKESIRKSSVLEFDTNTGDYNDDTDIFILNPAICTIQQYKTYNFIDEDIKTLSSRAEYYHLEINELEKFEFAIQHACKGDLYYLFKFFDKLELFASYKWDNRFNLTNLNWNNGELEKVKIMIKELKKENL